MVKEKPDKKTPSVYRAEIETHLIKVPEVRVTQVMKAEVEENFRESMKSEGAVNDIAVVKEGDVYWLSDGLHRLLEAQRCNQPKIWCKVKVGTLLDSMTQNLATTLQGRAKPADVVRVVAELTGPKFGLSLEDVQRKTGYKMDYIEKMQKIGTAHREVQRALDLDEIGIGHAFAISRVADHDVQIRLLVQCKQFGLTVEDISDVVAQTIEIIESRKQQPPSQEAPQPIPIPTVKCHFCEQEHPIRKVTGLNACMACYGLAYEYIQQKFKAGWKPGSEAATRAKEAVDPLSTAGGVA